MVGKSVSLAVIVLMIMLVSFSDHASLQASLPVSGINGGPLSNVSFAQDHLQKDTSQNNTSRNITKLNYTANNSIFGANTGNLALNVAPANKSRTIGILADPGVFGGSLTTSFNSNTMRTSDTEDINIDFPYLTDNAVYGPSAGNRSSLANILPFGPVDLAFPSIEQTVSTSQEYERTSYVNNINTEGMSCPFVSFKRTPLPLINFRI